VVLLAVRAMERCLFVLCFDRFISLQVVCGSDFVRVLRPSFEFRSTWLRGSSCDTTPPVLFIVSLCFRRLIFRRCRSSTLGAWFARACACGQRASFSAVWVVFLGMVGWLVAAGEARVRRVVFHTLVRVVPPSGLAILFMCFSVYSSFLSQFAIVVG
jgi:hypothetical protein